MVKLLGSLALAVIAAGGVAGAGAPAFAAPAAPAVDPATPPFPTDTSATAAVTWLRQHTSLGVGQFVVFGPDNVVVVVTDEIATRSPQVHQIGFRQEATSLDFVSRTGGRSVRGAGEIDCAAGTFKADFTELYAGSDLRGDRISRTGASPMPRQPPAGSATAAMIQMVCAAAGPAPASVASARAPGGPAAASPAPPPPTTRAETRVSELPPPAAAPPPPLRAAAPTPVKAAPPPPETVVQIGALATREAGERAWKRLAGLFPAQFSGRGIRIDQVNAADGAVVYRTMVDGFSTPAEAQALCARLKAANEPCLVRKISYFRGAAAAP